MFPSNTSNLMMLCQQFIDKQLVQILEYFSILILIIPGSVSCLSKPLNYSSHWHLPWTFGKQYLHNLAHKHQQQQLQAKNHHLQPISHYEHPTHHQHLTHLNSKESSLCSAQHQNKEDIIAKFVPKIHLKAQLCPRFKKAHPNPANILWAQFGLWADVESHMCAPSQQGVQIDFCTNGKIFSTLQ